MHKMQESAKIIDMELTKVRIETDRLLLVPTSTEYAEVIFREFTPEITQYMCPQTPTEISEMIDYLEDTIKKIEAGTDLTIAILDKQTGEYLGAAGLHRPNTPTPELGIWIKKSAFGKGIGREAIHGLRKWADENIEYKYITYPVDKRNIPSRKIPESLGGIIEAEYLTDRGEREPLQTIEYRIYPANTVQ